MEGVRIICQPWGYFPMTTDGMRYFARDRLYDRLDRPGRRSLIGIYADRGYGKTSLIYGYLARQTSAVLWYNLGELSADSRSGMETLAQGLAALEGAAFEGEQVEAFVVRQLYLRKEPLYLVMDDLQMVKESEEFFRLVRFLLEKGFPQLTMILLGTTRPKAAFLPLKARGQYLELTAEDLAFTQAETAAFFADYCRMPLEKYEADLIVQRTGGWVACYPLIAGYLSHLPPEKRALGLDFLRDIPDVFDYLSNELFEKEPPDLQAFLVKTSLMSELEPEVLRAYLSDPEAPEIVEDLARRSFLSRNEMGNWEYQRLFRVFLYERYAREDPDRVLQEHARLSEIYQQRQQYLTAFAHAVASMDYMRSSALMHQIVRRYNPVQFFNLIDGKLEEISPSLVLADMTLFLLRCIPEQVMMEFVPLLEEELRRAQQEENLLYSSVLQHRLASIVYHLGDPLRARALLEQAVEASKQLHDYPQLAFNLQLLADCCYEMQETDASMIYARHALFLTEKYHIHMIQIHCLEVLTRLAMNQENWEQAEESLDQAIGLMRPQSYAGFWLYVLKSRLLLHSAPQEAVDWARAAVQKLSPYCCGYDLAYTHWALGTAYLECQALDEAEQALETAYEASAFCGLLRCHIIDAQRALARRRGDREGEACKERERDDLRLQYGYTWLSETVIPAEPEVPVLEIRTLGAFSAEKGGCPLTFKRMSSLQVFLFLLVNRDHEINRDILVEELFAADKGDPVNRFHVALSALRKALGGDQGAIHPYLRRVKDRYQLRMEHIRLDADRFLMLSRDRSGTQEERIERLLRAIGLYQGDFLMEFPYESFLSAPREHLRRQQVKNLYEAARYFAACGEAARAVDYYERITRLEPYEEEAYLQCCRLLLAANARFRARAVGERMIAALEGEMGIPCRERLEKLFEAP